MDGTAARDPSKPRTCRRASLALLCAIALLSPFGAPVIAQPRAPQQGGAKAAPEKPEQKASTISGAGATFPYPLYAKWATAYAQHSGTRVNYQSIGSGGGIKQITAGTVDFGASDAPLEPSDLKQRGLVQWPTVVGGVVPVVNLPNVRPGQLKLTSDVLAGLFLGEITHWNDSRIARLNPGVQLPDTTVRVVHRSDGSGTTWIFTNYLKKVSPEWSQRVGTGTAVSWPTGIGGKGNEGVASYVQRIPGTIGYVEYAYVMQNKMTNVSLRNKAGQFVQPDVDSFSAAAANADWAHAPGFYLVLTDQPGAKSWPITGATFVLMRQQQQDQATARAVLSFFDWAYRNGDQMALQLNYVPMPDSVTQLVRSAWQNEVRGPNGQAVWAPPNQ